MNDLFKKLNVLIKASLNDIVSGDEPAGRARPRVRLGKNVDVEIGALRDRINEAVQYEDELNARIRQFDEEAARWDQQADQAVARHDEANARYAIEQMRRAQQRAEMTRSDLNEHQRATQELIERVNQLEAAVADARRRTSADAPADVLGERPETRTLPDLGNVLREARETITALGETAQAAPTPEPPTVDAEKDEAAVDDDLERRRQRLSQR